MTQLNQLRQAYKGINATFRITRPNWARNINQAKITIHFPNESPISYSVPYNENIIINSLQIQLSVWSNSSTT